MEQGKWNLKSRISNLLLKESSSDVEFLVGSPPQKFFCHKVILAAGSSVFEAMFYGAFKQKSPVKVPDVEPNGFALMLQYLYSDTIVIHDESDAFEAAYPAKKYMIRSLFDLCEGFLLNNLVLSPETVFDLHEASSFLEMKNLQDHCLRYVSRNARNIFTSESFINASKNTFQDVLSMDVMNIESEREIIEAVWRWGEQQCIEKGVKCSVENVRTCTKELLKYVRFFAMSMEELVKILERCQILETSDELTLLWNVAMPKTKRSLTMPCNISTDSRTRSISKCSKIQIPGEYLYNGNMTSFLVENHRTKAEITVTGSAVTILGLVIAFKPIPCYSNKDRSLEVEITVTNCSSNFTSKAKARFEAEANKDMREQLLLDDYIAIEEGQVGTLTAIVTVEGVRVMQCRGETLCFDLKKSEVSIKFDQSEDKRKQLMPIAELMVA